MILSLMNPMYLSSISFGFRYHHFYYKLIVYYHLIEINWKLNWEIENINLHNNEMDEWETYN